MKTAEYGLYGTATSLGLGEYMILRDIFGNELTDEQRNNSLTQSLFIMGGGAVANHADKLAGANAAFKTTGQQANTLLNRGVMHSQQFLRGVANDHRQAYNALKFGTQTAAQRIQQSLTPGGQQLAMAGGGRMSPDLGVRKEDVVVRSSGGGKSISNDVTVNKIRTVVGQGEQFTNGRKNRLKPEIRYKTGEYDYFYETDSLGRIDKFETDKLQFTQREKRLSHSRNTPGKVKGEDHAGHLVGDRFGGSPKIDNLVSQLSDVNLKQYKKIEDEWAKALKATPPKEVRIKLEILYSGDNARPDIFKVEYYIDEEPFRETIIN